MGENYKHDKWNIKKRQDVLQRLKDATDNFLKELKICPETGLIHGQNNMKFATFPYVGSRYGESERILFIGLDIGSDEKKDGVQPLEERRSAIEDKFSSKHNPHISGTYGTALFFLREEKSWQSCWEEMCKFSTFQQALKNMSQLEENPLSFVALTNYYKFVSPNRKNKGGGKDRRDLCQDKELKLLREEIEILEPEMVIFQSKSFSKDFLQKSGLCGLAKEIRVGPHPSWRGTRKPGDFVKLMVNFS